MTTESANLFDNGLFLGNEDWSDPYAGLTWESRNVVIQGADINKPMYSNSGVIVPSTWTQIAVDMLASKYFRKAGVPEFVKRVVEPGIPDVLQRRVATQLAEDYDFQIGVKDYNKEKRTGAETDARQVFDRMAGAWAYQALKSKYMDSDEAIRFYNEVRYALARQMFAPNSPQWFNTGLYWAYGITGVPVGSYCFDENGNVIEAPDSYSHPQGHACFIQSVNDNLVGQNGIMDLWMREARIFKFGSGAGVNVSALRGKDESLSGGGKSSGLLSFLKIGDRSAGSIQSGGVCLAPTVPVYTEQGPKEVQELEGKEFICLSYDPPAKRFKAKKATAWKAGRKRVLRITTDKGFFDLSYDHPVRLSNHQVMRTEDLKPGMSLFACSIDREQGYLRVHLRDGMKGKSRFHRMIAHDVMGFDITNMSVHHHDENVDNNAPSNLQVMPQSEHAFLHGKREAAKGTHLFQTQRFSHKGEANGMNRTGSFYADSAKVTAYRELKSKELMDRGNAAEMQKLAVTQKMLNLGFELINAGYDISNFESYVKARQKHRGRIASLKKLRKSFEKLFGTYEQFLEQLSVLNHRVVSVTDLGEMDVYDVNVQCPTPDDKSPESGHNFVIWPNKEMVGTGITVFNTRRAAKMICLDIDHPDILDFIHWKLHEEDKVAMLVSGSLKTKQHLKGIADLAKQGDKKALRKAVAAAKRDAVSEKLIEQAIQAAEEDAFEETIVYSTSFEGAAYETVSGQNSNNSVRVPNSFFSAVENNEQWPLYARTDLKKAGIRLEINGWDRREVQPVKTISAKYLWDRIAYVAWRTADPGIHFDDTINEWNTCKADERIRGTNPCSEYHWLDDTGCNLASLNLARFVKDTATFEFDIPLYRKVCRMVTIILDLTVQMASYPSKQIAERTKLYRTLGIGYANMGTVLMLAGLPYASEKGYALAGAIASLMQSEALITSSILASRIGTFPRYVENRGPMLEVVWNHMAATTEDTPFIGLSNQPPRLISKLLTSIGFDIDEVKNLAVKAHMCGKTHGYRNAQVSVVAPTGTIGLVMSCDTTGIEPDYALVKIKKLVGGGYVKIANEAIGPALSRLGYKPNEVTDIINYVVGTNSLLTLQSPINANTLREKGIKPEVFKFLEKRLTSAFSVRDVFNHYMYVTLCKEAIKHNGMVNLSVQGQTLDELVLEHVKEIGVGDPEKDFLNSLGFSEADIAKADKILLGAGTVEGAPHLQEKDYAVFDCANRCGDGVRYIDPMGHIRMVAAVQPFTSGGISKTINVPGDAKIADIKDYYIQSWKLGIKCVAMYRDGCKLSQPLSSASSKLSWIAEIDPEVEDYKTPTPAKLLEKITEHVNTHGKRLRLPDRRNGHTQKARIGNQTVYLRTGEYQNGKVGEIFLEVSRQGAAYRGMANAFAIAVSLGLQHGVPVDEYVDAFVNTKFDPAGPVGLHDRIKNCTSLVDYVARHLGLFYLGMEDLAHVPASSAVEETVSEQTAEAVEVSVAKHRSDRDIARAKGYEGEACGFCSSWTLVRNGTCLLCETCGKTNGCV